MFRKISWGLLALSILALYLFSPHSPKDAPFSEKAISSSLAPDPRWATLDPTPEEKIRLNSILSQKFIYLGEGTQAYTFESENQKTVLKFFKMRRLVPSFKDYLYPRTAAQKVRRLHVIFAGHKNGFQDLRQETGLIWIHLNKTASLKQKIILIDAKGEQHCIDADQAEFVLQEKAEPIFECLSRLYKEGKVAEAQKVINDFYIFIQNRTDRGYMDRDKVIGNNYGLVGDRPIQIDVGQLYKRRDRKVRPQERHLQNFKERIELWHKEQGIRSEESASS